MKIFDLMQSKLNVTLGSKRPNSKSIHAVLLIDNTVLGPCKEDFNDWPDGLLAIGTFGNNVNKDLEMSNFKGNIESPSQEHLQGLTSEELKNLQELTSLILSHKQADEQSASAAELEQVANYLPHKQSSLEDETTSSNVNSDGSNDRTSTLQNSTNVLCKGKDIYLDNTNTAIGKKSLSFLLKRLFVCRSCFYPARSLRDPIPESRMEKILKAILKKKVYTQSSSPSLSAKKYLERRHSPKTTNEDATIENQGNESKWVRTDSESNVVLESACERVIVGDLYCDISLGLYVIRGENVVLIGELDLGKEELPPHMTQVSEADIKKALKVEKEATDLKGSMRKRMEFLDFD
ncbi:hypothetical protein FNV43_RR17986 [Rhamnella rubrinervis]|uniref:Sm domain-containing protein n=1 Tax=Rhamnella rubrinervis TaxID=2594499 RepID=A0A8K0GW42_9ROSA|nr:hypothetical protein FNV43_RR17986 [Rhamnella rubrinervis]